MIGTDFVRNKTQSWLKLRWQQLLWLVRVSPMPSKGSIGGNIFNWNPTTRLASPSHLFRNQNEILISLAIHRLWTLPRWCWSDCKIRRFSANLFFLFLKCDLRVFLNSNKLSFMTSLAKQHCLTLHSVVKRQFRLNCSESFVTSFTFSASRWMNYQFFNWSHFVFFLFFVKIFNLDYFSPIFGRIPTDGSCFGISVTKLVKKMLLEFLGVSEISSSHLKNFWTADSL